MLKYIAYMNLNNGDKKCNHIKITEKTVNGVNLVYVSALAGSSNLGVDRSLNPDCGIEIEIKPDKEIKEYMANYRFSEFWCKPFFGTDLKKVPEDTQAFVAKLEDDSFLVVLPVVGDTYKNVLCGDENGLKIKAFSWCDNLYDYNGLCFSYAVGKNPSELIEKLVSESLRALGSGVRTRSKRRYPEIFEYLGWCSWDSMQIRVSEDGLVEKCKEFKAKDIPVKWAIIDDMWAEIRDFYDREYSDRSEMHELMHCSRMYHFDADPRRFPNGLKGSIEKIHEFGIKVGMWHPTTGYWHGFDEKGTAYNILKDTLIKTEAGYIIPDWHTEKSYMYYKILHDFFIDCGAEFVKIDNQSMIRRYYKGAAPVGQIAREYHDGMEASVGEHFDNAMINCMGMASEDIWSRSISPIARCSNDFLPENKQWFTSHILQCAYNSFTQGQFYWCDWDMWWTDDGQAAKNSLMRAISGGPIYVSDKIERSRAEILAPLCLKDGKILRCDRVCIPTSDCISSDPTTNKRALKLQNTANGCGILAAVNIDENEDEVRFTISPSEIDGIDAAEEYAVYEHYSKTLIMMKPNEKKELKLKNADDYRLYIFVPVHDGFAPIGRTDKFISPKTIAYIHKGEIVLKENGPYAFAKDGKLFFE